MFRASFCGVILSAALLLGGNAPAFAQQLSLTEVIGGSGGNGFSDAQPPAGARVVEVRVRSAEVVDSVQIVYALADGRTVTGSRHGGSGGRESILRLDADEHIIGLSGRYGDSIDSLRIHTNKRVSQPFGGGGGNRDYRIEIPAGNQAAGFAGRAGDYLDAIGLTYTPIRAPRRSGLFSGAPAGPSQMAETPIAGGGGGSGFSDREAPLGARISEVRVRASDLIDAVQVIYLLPDGRSADGARHGGAGGRDFIFRLDSDEYVIGLSGRYGDNIDSLLIHTNKRTSQLFGGRGGDRAFRVGVPAGNQAVGFAGRAGDYLDAIGLTYSTATGTRAPQRPSRRPERGQSPMSLGFQIFGNK